VDELTTKQLAAVRVDRVERVERTDRVDRASTRAREPAAAAAPRTASEAPAELLAALKRDLLAKLPAPAVAALTRELDAALAGGPSAPSAARLVQRFQEIEDVLEALYLSSAPAPGAE
jgi:hypothetical protein